MSILLRDTRTGIITSTDLFGDTLGLYLRENPDIVRVGLGTTADADYYVLLNSNNYEFVQPNTSNNLIFNPQTGSLSGIISISGTIGYASNAGISTYATTAGIATYATSSGFATYATTAGIATNVTTNANLTGHITSVGNAAVLGSFTSAQLATALTDETGSGSAVFATNPTLVTPALGTPSSGNLENCTFPTLNQSTNGNAATVTTNANLTGHITSVGNAAVLGSFTSAQLATALTDETGSGANVFATSPTLVTPALGTPSSGNLENCTSINASNLSTGTVPTARLASGTANSSTYLRGDQTWQSISAPAAEFASGTTIVFYQASAPTGWTKSTSHDNKALRVVSGTGGGSGGSTAFTSVFASRGVPLPEHAHSASLSTHDGHQHSGPTNNQNTNHTHTFSTGNQNQDHAHSFTTNTDGSHNHQLNAYPTNTEAGGYGFTGPGGAFQDRVIVSGTGGRDTTTHNGHQHSGGTGGQSANHQHGGTTDGMSVNHYHDFSTQPGGAHGHSLTINNNGTAGASMDFAVQYIDVIICSKN